MIEVIVRADLFDGAWSYFVDHPYDLSSFESVENGPFDDLTDAKAAVARIEEMVGGNSE